MPVATPVPVAGAVAAALSVLLAELAAGATATSLLSDAIAALLTVNTARNNGINFFTEKLLGLLFPLFPHRMEEILIATSI